MEQSGVVVDKSKTKKKMIKGVAPMSRPPLLRTLNHQELAAKKSRLECLLFQQYAKEFRGDADSRTQIKRYIRELVGSEDNVTDFSNTQIAALEEQVRKLSLASSKKEQIDRTSSQQEVAAEECRRSSVVVQSVPATTHLQVPEVLSKPDWRILNAIVSLKEEELEAAKNKAKSSRKEIFRRDLDAQVLFTSLHFT
jgi:hypothetical protein